MSVQVENIPASTRNMFNPSQKTCTTILPWRGWVGKKAPSSIIAPNGLIGAFLLAAEANRKVSISTQSH